MQQDAQNRAALGIVVLVLLGADLAQNHRVHRFQMRRVGGQRQVHPVAVEFAVRGRAKVVFHIARAIDIFRLEAAALKFVENGAVRLAHHIRQNVQPAPVRHADGDLLYPPARRRA